MEGKLIKKDNHYFLEVEPYTLNTLQRNTLIANTFDKPKGDILQLSLTNCQAIERGYDLDELTENFYERTGYHDFDSHSYKLGFQKALEVNADKRFTLKEMVDCWNRALEFQTHKETLGEYIKSLKQTEWDVTFNPDELDAEGRLILKRKK